jgi:surfactin synthase thioesterase subunit
LLYALPEAEFIDFTMGDFSLRIVPGGHFFLNSPDGRLLREVEGTLLPWCG